MQIQNHQKVEDKIEPNASQSYDYIALTEQDTLQK